MKFLGKFIIVLFCTTELYAADFKVRAREHFEVHKITSGDFSETYKGLSNTLNFWWEKPYDISYGFSFSPVLSSLKSDDADAFLGERIKFFNLGFEVKYFLNEYIQNLYTRPGIGLSRLAPDKGDDLNGEFFYLGLGYEYPFEKFGLALELAYRYSKLSEDTEITSFTPSVGFHMYNQF